MHNPEGLRPTSPPELNPEIQEVYERILDLKNRGLVDPNMHDLQQEAMLSLDRTLRQGLAERDPIVPEQGRQLESVMGEGGEHLGQHERIRDHRGEEYNTDVWLVLDFDDVLNDTTTLQKELRARAVQGLGISVEEVDNLWDQSYHVGQAGKRIFRYDTFVSALKERCPPDRVDSVLDVNHASFLNPELVRMILAAKSADASPSTVRVSILTYGDMAYQRDRVRQSGIEDLVDDVLYSEGSKRELLESVRRREYDPARDLGSGKKWRKEPFIITVDDSPENIEDYEAIDKVTHQVNVRYIHPHAKRADSPTQAKRAVNIKEVGDREAAVNLFKLVQLTRDYGLPAAAMIMGASSPERAHTNEELYAAIKDPELLDRLLLETRVESWNGWQGDISYTKNLFGRIQRSATRIEPDNPRPEKIDSTWKIGLQSTIENREEVLRSIDWSEFIREAE